MFFKQFISLLLYFLIFSFIGMLFSSYLAPKVFRVTIDADSFVQLFRNNWAVIALFLSELAAILPGKPKGIIQVFIKLIGKVFFSRNVKNKNYLL